MDGPARQSVELWKTSMIAASRYPNESGGGGAVPLLNAPNRGK